MEDVLTHCFIFGSSTKIDTARSRFSGPLPLDAVSPDVRPTCAAARDLAAHVRDEQEGVLDGAALVLRAAPDLAREREQPAKRERIVDVEAPLGFERPRAASATGTTAS